MFKKSFDLLFRSHEIRPPDPESKYVSIISSIMMKFEEMFRFFPQLRTQHDLHKRHETELVDFC